MSALRLVNNILRVAATPEGQEVLRVGVQFMETLIQQRDPRRLQRMEQRLRRLEQERQAVLKQLQEAQRLNREAQETLDTLRDAWEACEAEADIDTH